jgi:hypothetical protein
VGADCREGGGEEQGAVHGQVQTHRRIGQEKEGGGQLGHCCHTSLPGSCCWINIAFHSVLYPTPTKYCIGMVVVKLA